VKLFDEQYVKNMKLMDVNVPAGPVSLSLNSKLGLSLTATLERSFQLSAGFELFVDTSLEVGLKVEWSSGKGTNVIPIRKFNHNYGGGMNLLNDLQFKIWAQLETKPELDIDTNWTPNLVSLQLKATAGATLTPGACARTVPQFQLYWGLSLISSLNSLTISVGPFSATLISSKQSWSFEIKKSEVLPFSWAQGCRKISPGVSARSLGARTADDPKSTRTDPQYLAFNSKQLLNVTVSTLMLIQSANTTGSCNPIQKCDSYIKFRSCKSGECGIWHFTRTIDDDDSPQWNEEININIPSGASLQVQILTEDFAGDVVIHDSLVAVPSNFTLGCRKGCPVVVSPHSLKLVFYSKLDSVGSMYPGMYFLNQSIINGEDQFQEFIKPSLNRFDFFYIWMVPVTNDPDLYIQNFTLPTLEDYFERSYLPDGNDDIITLTKPKLYIEYEKSPDYKPWDREWIPFLDGPWYLMEAAYSPTAVFHLYSSPVVIFEPEYLNLEMSFDVYPYAYFSDFEFENFPEAGWDGVVVNVESLDGNSNPDIYVDSTTAQLAAVSTEVAESLWIPSSVFAGEEDEVIFVELMFMPMVPNSLSSSFITLRNLRYLNYNSWGDAMTVPKFSGKYLFAIVMELPRGALSVQVHLSHSVQRIGVFDIMPQGNFHLQNASFKIEMVSDFDFPKRLEQTYVAVIFDNEESITDLEMTFTPLFPYSPGKSLSTNLIKNCVAVKYEPRYSGPSAQVFAYVELLNLDMTLTHRIGFTGIPLLNITGKSTWQGTVQVPSENPSSVLYIHSNQAITLFIQVIPYQVISFAGPKLTWAVSEVTLFEIISPGYDALFLYCADSEILGGNSVQNMQKLSDVDGVSKMVVRTSNGKYYARTQNCSSFSISSVPKLTVEFSYEISVSAVHSAKAFLKVAVNEPYALSGDVFSALKASQIVSSVESSVGYMTGSFLKEIKPILSHNTSQYTRFQDRQTLLINIPAIATYNPPEAETLFYVLSDPTFSFVESAFVAQVNSKVINSGQPSLPSEAAIGATNYLIGPVIGGGVAFVLVLLAAIFIVRKIRATKGGASAMENGLSKPAQNN